MKLKWLGLIILIALIPRMFIISQPIETLITKILPDDAFYGYTMSKGIVDGNGISNGFEQTNGLQLFWILLRSPLFFLSNEPAVLIKLIMMIQILLDVLMIASIYLLSKLLDRRIAYASATLYALNPIIAFTTLNVLETSLNMLLLSIAIYFYLRKNNSKSVVDWILLGVLFGFSVLTRLDSVFLITALLVYLFHKRKLKINMVPMFIIPAIFLSIWFFWNIVNFGTIHQSSELARYFDTHNLYKEGLTQTEFLQKAAIAFGKNILFLFHYFGAINLSIWSGVIGMLFAVLLFLGAKEVRELFPTAIFYFLLLLFFSFYMISPSFRYLAPFLPFATIFIAAGIFKVSQKIKVDYRPILGFLILVIIFNGLMLWDKGYFPWQATAIDGASWIKENTSDDDIVSSFNSGIFTVLSGKNLINLDGVVNWGAINAVRNRNVTSYMISKNVSYWIDAAFLDEDIYFKHMRGEEIDIINELKWSDILDEKERLELIYSNYNIFSGISGRNSTVVWFVYKLT